MPLKNDGLTNMKACTYFQEACHTPRRRFTDKTKNLEQRTLCPPRCARSSCPSCCHPQSESRYSPVRWTLLYSCFQFIHPVNCVSPIDSMYDSTAVCRLTMA